MLFCFLVFFFFKQKTAYEMRISDWSSDVCSSDLHARGETVIYEAHLKGLTRARDCFPAHDRGTFGALGHAKNIEYLQRSEERRVGKECVSTCRSRWSPDHYKKKSTHRAIYHQH